MFYFIVYSNSKLEDTKKEFVRHWGGKHSDLHRPECKKTQIQAGIDER